MQALATVFHIASNGSWALPVCLLAGLAVILIRQIWTVQMGMRGLIYTDMYQGIFAYIIAAIVCVFLLVSPNSPANWGMLSNLSDDLLKVPGDGGDYGSMYLFCQIFTGVVGALCWPMSFVRIYTAKDIRSVKKSTNYAIIIAGVFYALLTLTMLAATNIPEVVANPQAGWTTLLEQYGGTWLLGLGLVMIFAGSIGHIDGSVQAVGTQIANDIIGSRKSLTDRQKTIFSKACMVVFVLVSAVLAYFANGMPRLQLLAQLSYQGIVQIAVPLFFGIFFKFGNKYGALPGMISVFSIAAILTVIYPDDIPALESLTSGVVGLLINLAVYIIVSIATRGLISDEERSRVEELFVVASNGTTGSPTLPTAKPRKGLGIAAKIAPSIKPIPGMADAMSKESI